MYLQMATSLPSVLSRKDLTMTAIYQQAKDYNDGIIPDAEESNAMFEGWNWTPVDFDSVPTLWRSFDGYQRWRTIEEAKRHVASCMAWSYNLGSRESTDIHLQEGSQLMHFAAREFAKAVHVVQKTLDVARKPPPPPKSFSERSLAEKTLKEEYILRELYTIAKEYDDMRITEASRSNAHQEWQRFSGYVRNEVFTRCEKAIDPIWDPQTVQRGGYIFKESSRSHLVHLIMHIWPETIAEWSSS